MLNKILVLSLLAITIAGLRTALSADTSFLVRRQMISDSKAVFATVESVNQVPARARIGGTLTSLTVDEGSAVSRDQIVAQVVDEKLALQIKALGAQIKALESQLALVTAEHARAETLFRSGTISKVRLDQAQTAVDAATGELRARNAEREVINQQLTEGEVHAPTAGRVIGVPVTIGTVVLPGETIGVIATENFILRLRLPERHARYIKNGDPVALEGREPGEMQAAQGKVIKVYPQIDNGRVVADAQVDGLGDFFVGERVRVRISTGERTAFRVPVEYLTTRVGVDFVRLKATEGESTEVAVQRGQLSQTGDGKAQVEVLSGLREGDVLLLP